MNEILKEPLVSVIVPVYKAEKYINQCVDSLLEQSYRNIEVILVDDGSPDRSGAICDKYAASDSRVKVIHQPNCGVGVARQSGYEKAAGEYIVHADPDDWVEPTMIEEVVRKAQQDDYDYVYFDYYDEYADGTSVIRQNTPDYIDSTKRLLELSIAGYRCVSLCFAVVRRECCKGISFDSKINYGEDQLFTIKLLNRDIKVSCVKKPFYHYRRSNTASLTHCLSDMHMESNIHFAEIVSAEISKRNDLDNNCIEQFKINCLKLLVLSGKRKYFVKLRELFPEVHSRLIEEGRRYNVLNPVSGSLSIALCRSATLAWIIYVANMHLISIKNFLWKSNTRKTSLVE